MNMQINEDKQRQDYKKEQLLNAIAKVFQIL